ncbi:MAG: autophagy protein Apg9-domain-containing protein [Olpidium bornovanus]|uniref:Autophagy-related protein 9 n=1 Tax=Olpidium bornovanus TaxID=278681 RepID=A0A8H8DJB1_9FUNG|nr:MAG: autophagy protein Apg9-domain-containing protein [Olpidium bornovanus]
MGFLNAIFAPFIVVYLLMFFFFRYFEVNLGTTKIFLAFIAGSFAAVLVAVTLYDQELLLGFELSPNHTVFFYISVFGAVLAVARSQIPRENEVFEPERYLQLVVESTHYLPDEWRDRMHTEAVRREFGSLFEFKVLIFFRELLSVLATPWILWFSLPSCSEVCVCVCARARVCGKRKRLFRVVERGKLTKAPTDRGTANDLPTTSRRNSLIFFANSPCTWKALATCAPLPSLISGATETPATGLQPWPGLRARGCSQSTARWRSRLSISNWARLSPDQPPGMAAAGRGRVIIPEVRYRNESRRGWGRLFFIFGSSNIIETPPADSNGALPRSRLNDFSRQQRPKRPSELGQHGPETGDLAASVADLDELHASLVLSPAQERAPRRQAHQPHSASLARSSAARQPPPPPPPHAYPAPTRFADPAPSPSSAGSDSGGSAASLSEGAAARLRAYAGRTDGIIMPSLYLSAAAADAARLRGSPPAPAREQAAAAAAAAGRDLTSGSSQQGLSGSAEGASGAGSGREGMLALLNQVRRPRPG